MKNGKVFLLLNGETPVKTPELNDYEIICATDGAYHFLKEKGITPDFISGFPVALIQIIGLIALMNSLKIATLSSGAVFGAVFSAGIWLIVDLQMVSTTTFVSYSYVGLDAVLSAIMGAIGGGLVAWSLKKFA